MTMWSKSQRKAFEILVDIGETFFQADWSSFSIRPRFDSLIIGPSGSGKSHLVRSVAAHLNVPFLKLCHGEWIVIGARSMSLPTVQKVRNFVRDHPRGIIYIDELDKAQAGFRSEWGIAVFAEIFALLDRESPPSPRDSPWNEEELHRLKNDFWFVGSGTWQVIWNSRILKQIGFGRSHSALDHEQLTQKIRSAHWIPEELLFRFSARHIFLDPASEQDFRRAARRLGLSKLARALGHSLDYRKAAADGLEARWLEEIHAQLLVRAWKKGRRDLLPLRGGPIPPAADTQEEIPF